MTTSPLSVTDDTLDRAAARLTGGLNGWSTTAAPELGVEPVVMVDGPLGLVSRGLDERDTSSLLPSGTALAATWDLQVVTEVGLLMGAEAVEREVDVVLGPNVNIPRTPLSGRAFEMFSEDPWLSGVLATAWSAGLQQQGIGVCAKHLVGNDTETERRFMNAQIGPVALREVYLRPFEMLVEAGVEMILMAYNRVNGVHCAENADLIDIVKNEWAFDGVLVSDWFGVVDTIASATAGLDLEMPGPARFFGEQLVDAVARGDVTAERLADMTQRLLRLAERTGRRSGVAHPAKGTVPVDRDDVLERAAAASFTLLENRDQMLAAGRDRPVPHCGHRGERHQSLPAGRDLRPGQSDRPGRLPAGRPARPARVDGAGRLRPGCRGAGAVHPARTRRDNSGRHSRFAAGDLRPRRAMRPRSARSGSRPPSSGSARFPVSVPPRTRGSGSPRC